MKKIKILIIFIILVMTVMIGMLVYKTLKDSNNVGDNPEETNKVANLKETEGLLIVATLRDTLFTDSAWCATFQLVWNDMKNNVVGQDVIFTPQLEMVENLNLEEFTEDMISDEYYYKKWGLKTLALKEEIENAILEKFNETSDLLDNIDWSERALDNDMDDSINRYIFYAMLKRNFEFVNEFDELEDSSFGDTKEGVKYFGIDSSTEDSVGEQIDVLFYNSKEDFAIVLNTKDGDEVILYKTKSGSTFSEVYENMLSESEKYEADAIFNNIDEIKVPNIKFDEKREYTELQGQNFPCSNGRTGEIIKAIQTIQFELDRTGGSIKSEAIIEMKTTSIAIETNKIEPRYFYLDDTFVLFLREEGQELPYFAARINDITKFQ